MTLPVPVPGMVAAAVVVDCGKAEAWLDAVPTADMERQTTCGWRRRNAHTAEVKLRSNLGANCLFFFFFPSPPSKLKTSGSGES
jgi:hypothetical protein